MKRSKLILLALLGLFFFNSCKDDDIEKPEPIIPISLFPTINKYKALTGLHIADAQNIVEGWGSVFTVTTTAEDHSYTLYQFKELYRYYDLLIVNDTVFGVSYWFAESTIEPRVVFESYSKECLAYISEDTITYYGATKFFKYQDEETTFTNPQSFATYYEENRSEISVASQVFKTSKELLSSRFYGPLSYYGEFLLRINYYDLERAPAGISNSFFPND